MTIFNELMVAISKIKALPPIHPITSIFSHPDHFGALKNASIAGGSHGVPVYSTNVPKYASQYKWPKCRFVEYDDSDIPWGQYAGIGGYVDDKTKPVVWVTRNPVDVNPFFMAGEEWGCITS